MSKINTDKEKIQELLTRGVEKVYPKQEFLEKALKSGKKLSLYLGIDPTGPSLHLGHAIILEKLRQFQELGHQVILLIGDFTGTVGDPTDKKATRQPLSKAQVLKNAKDYQKQAETFLKFTGPNKVELKHNSEWLGEINFTKVMEISSKFTVQQLLERDMFQERMKAGKPIHLHEFMYPVLQAYDCVEMKEGGVDGEIGGNDQTFNMLAGRTLMKSIKGKEKFVITMKLLTDTTGTKMGKTEGNMLTLNDSAKDMFGKVMSWTDDMIIPGYELCTRMAMKDIKKIAKSRKNPRDLKFALAKKIVALYHGDTKAKQAGQEFVNMFKKGGRPDNIPEFVLNKKKISPIDLLVELKFVSSKSEARRLIDGGGMKINDQKVANWKDAINLKSGDIVQAGKRKFAKIK
ncbi:tyrosine--tRNA ligase [bacterium]|nr:tyrosine--tRNA ligase [bacterium]